jgi:putative effector of murein hydrolase
MEQFVGSDLVLLTLTVGFYCLGSALYSRTKFALLHPVLLGFVAMILYLKLFGIGYEHYRRSTELLNFGLGLSVVALGYLMYEQLEHMRGRSSSAAWSEFLVWFIWRVCWGRIGFCKLRLLRNP